MPLFPRNEILGNHSDTDFHGCAADEIHSCRAGYQFASINGLYEVDPVYRDRDTGAAGMTHGANSRCSIYHGKQLATEHVP